MNKLLRAASLSACALISATSLPVIAQDLEPTPSEQTASEQITLMTPEANVFSGGLFAGFTFGGDELAEVEFDDDYDEDITAGELLYFGLSLKGEKLFATNLKAKINVGHHFDGAFADNGDTTFSRNVVEGLIGWQLTEEFSLYVGATKHSSVELEFDLDYFLGTDFDTTEFDDATGTVIEGTYSFGDIGELALRFVDIDYEVADKEGFITNSDIDGSHVGILYHYYF
ncbi:hypothetical protein HR060_15080 [Catenovulum sp. SM1970]|uniref:hypothetical protein n=1 Tax=Marinifaba aquimaris TaxID=2741323 RepID=UPI0015726F04|nr:hypothetical protein [Marinifaba aquimaris]NTS78173.1 hypothetical protein [Marinifaba aquimaris]